MRDFQQLEEQPEKIDNILVLGMSPFESHVVNGVGTIASKIIIV